MLLSTYLYANIWIFSPQNTMYSNIIRWDKLQKPGGLVYILDMDSHPQLDQLSSLSLGTALLNINIVMWAFPGHSGVTVYCSRSVYGSACLQYCCWIVASTYLACINAGTHICIAHTLVELPAAETSSGPNDIDIK